MKCPTCLEEHEPLAIQAPPDSRAHSLVCEYVMARRAVEDYRHSHFVGHIVPAPLVVLMGEERRAWNSLCDEADKL
jgi:hypothetical protein